MLRYSYFPVAEFINAIHRVLQNKAHCAKEKVKKFTTN